MGSWKQYAQEKAEKRQKVSLLRAQAAARTLCHHVAHAQPFKVPPLGGGGRLGREIAAVRVAIATSMRLELPVVLVMTGASPAPGSVGGLGEQQVTRGGESRDDLRSASSLLLLPLGGEEKHVVDRVGQLVNLVLEVRVLQKLLRREPVLRLRAHAVHEEVHKVERDSSREQRELCPHGPKIVLMPQHQLQGDAPDLPDVACCGPGSSSCNLWRVQVR
eukprot:745971-Hanusia_phi.AAC.2